MSEGIPWSDFIHLILSGVTEIWMVGRGVSSGGWDGKLGTNCC